MEERDRVALRGVAMATLSTVGPVLRCVRDCLEDPAIDPLVLVGAEYEAQRTLGRARGALRALTAQHPRHSRVVRLATRAHDRCSEALRTVLSGLPDTPIYNRDAWQLSGLRSEQALKAAERAARAILVEVDGPEGWRRTA